MKAKVESLEDLKAERARLSNQVQLSQVRIRKDLGLIKKEIQPTTRAVRFVGNFLKNKNTGVVGMGVNFAADALLRRTFLRGASPVVRWAVPVLVRNLTGSLIEKSAGTQTAEKVLNWVKDKTAPRDGTALVVNAPKPRLVHSLAWQGLDVAEKMVRWVKRKTDERPKVIEVVEEHARLARPADIIPIDYVPSPGQTPS
jgi:hypothetical protein